MAENPNQVNKQKELTSMFDYLKSNGFSGDDADLFLADEMPVNNFERLFVWPVEPLEGKQLLVDFYKNQMNDIIDIENTDKKLKGRFLCLTFIDSN